MQANLVRLLVFSELPLPPEVSLEAQEDSGAAEVAAGSFTETSSIGNEAVELVLDPADEDASDKTFTARNPARKLRTCSNSLMEAL